MPISMVGPILVLGPPWQAFGGCLTACWRMHTHLLPVMHEQSVSARNASLQGPLVMSPSPRRPAWAGAQLPVALAPLYTGT